MWLINGIPGWQASFMVETTWKMRVLRSSGPVVTLIVGISSSISVFNPTSQSVGHRPLFEGPGAFDVCLFMFQSALFIRLSAGRLLPWPTEVDRRHGNDHDRHAGNDTPLCDRRTDCSHPVPASRHLTSLRGRSCGSYSASPVATCAPKADASRTSGRVSA